ncbi:MAG: hypothetical protein HYU67_00875 [Flavobacteriia bacterium]|nr:hypothetical protein [Flavobacteriia bacterium]
MIKNLFSSLPSNSKVWLYSSSRKLEEKEQIELNLDLDLYAEKWFSHGKTLFAKAALINPYIVCFAVDDTKVHASGCSIDDSVKFLKFLGEKYKTNFFDRTKFWTITNGNVVLQNFSQLNDNPERELFNLQAKTVKELEEKPLIKVKEYLAQFNRV